MSKHLQENEIHHQRLMVNSVATNIQQNSRLISAVQMLEDQLSNLGIRVGSLEKDHDANAQRIEELEERLSKFQSQYTGRVSSLEKAFASGNQSMLTTTHTRGVEATVLTTSSDDVQLLRRVPELFTKQEEMSRAVEKLMSSSVDQELHLSYS